MCEWAMRSLLPLRKNAWHCEIVIGSIFCLLLAWQSIFGNYSFVYRSYKLYVHVFEILHVMHYNGIL